MVPQQIFSLQQVQTACRQLIEEESHLITSDVLPRRSGLVAHIFAIMAFDDHEYIDRNLMSDEQAQLIEHYSH